MSAGDRSQAQASTLVRPLGDFKLRNMNVFSVGEISYINFQKENFYCGGVVDGGACNWTLRSKWKLKTRSHSR